jgi:hypothetical protein
LVFMEKWKRVARECCTKINGCHNQMISWRHSEVKILQWYQH